MEDDGERGVDGRGVGQPDDLARSRLLVGPRAVRRDDDVDVVREQGVVVGPFVHVDDADGPVEAVGDDVGGDPVEQLDGVVVPVGELDELVLGRRLRTLVLLLGGLGRGGCRGLGGRLCLRLGSGRGGPDLRRGRGCVAGGGFLSTPAGEGQTRYQNNGGCDVGKRHGFPLLCVSRPAGERLLRVRCWRSGGI